MDSINFPKSNDVPQADNVAGTPHESFKKKPNNKKWFIVLIVILVVIVAAAIVFIVVFKKDKMQPLEPQGNQAVEPLIRYGQMALESDKTSLAIGETTQVNVVMDTQNSNIVVASAVVEYDADVLELVNVDQTGSVLSMAIIKNQEAGKVEVIRGVPGDTDYMDIDDGYNGSNGKLVSLEFKALKSGRTDVKFNSSESDMILDDGRGTAMVVEYKNVIINVN